MRYVRLTSHFIRASIQEEAAYSANFWINLLYSLLNLASGILGVMVLFNQVQSIRGWGFAETLALLGIYLIASALRNLFIGPSLDALAGMDGEVWQGTLDFTLLRPVNIQFMASLRRWRIFSLLDLLFGLGVLVAAALQMEHALTAIRFLAFLLALGAGIIILYAILLAFTALVFWSPGVLFTWIFDGIFQMARYPIGLYPGWLRLVLTWVVPVGLITTVPVQALTGQISPAALAGSLVFAMALALGASLLFRVALRRYNSASS